jgi:hypothetical protein
VKKLTRGIIAATIVLGMAGGTVACTSDAQRAYDARQKSQQQTTLKDSIALENLKKKRDRENDPNKIRYLYLMNYGQIVGYYIAKGNITSNASQIAPEEEVVKSYGGDGYVVDSAQDDGTYGDGDPGVFFFTADGTMVVTSLDYIQSDQPLKIDVPRLGGDDK